MLRARSNPPQRHVEHGVTAGDQPAAARSSRILRHNPLGASPAPAVTSPLDRNRETPTSGAKSSFIGVMCLASGEDSTAKKAAKVSRGSPCPHVQPSASPPLDRVCCHGLNRDRPPCSG